METLAFVFCVEPGRLEAEACLLARSIRRYGGRLASSPLYAVQPRGAQPLRPETLAVFATEGVTHRAAVLNGPYAQWPTTNKVFGVADIESIAETEFLVFLDTDSVIINEPLELLLPAGHDLGVQPTVQQFRGSTGPGDPNDPFWLNVYRICDVPEPPYVLTMIDRVRIRGYYNGGLIAMRRTAGLGRRWLDFLMRIGPDVPNKARYNLDQVALAAVAAGLPGRVRVLPSTYNYNIGRRQDFVLEADRSAGWDSLVHLHYHDAFRRPDFLSTVRPPLDPEDERCRWLSQFLPLPQD